MENALYILRNQCTESWIDGFHCMLLKNLNFRFGARWKDSANYKYWHGAMHSRPPAKDYSSMAHCFWGRSCRTLFSWLCKEGVYASKCLSCRVGGGRSVCRPVSHSWFDRRPLIAVGRCTGIRVQGMCSDVSSATLSQSGLGQAHQLQSFSLGCGNEHRIYLAEVCED